MSDFLQQELQEFFRAVRRSKGEEELIQAAAERLLAVVHRAEPYGDDLGEAWEHLAVEQRWEYLRVVSLLGTATHELRRLGVPL